MLHMPEKADLRLAKIDDVVDGRVCRWFHGYGIGVSTESTFLPGILSIISIT